MRKIWPIVVLNLKKFFKSPGALVLMFVLPALFSFIFGGITVKSQQTKPIVNIVASSGEIPDRVVQLLKKDQHFNWKITTLKQAKKNVSKEDAIAAVVINKDIQEKIIQGKPLFEIMIERKTQDYLALEPHLQGTARLVTSSYQTASELDVSMFPNILAAAADHKGVIVEKQTVQKDTNNLVELNLMFVGFAMMFMMFGLSGAASTILDERIGGTWERLLITPARKYEIISGYILGYFLIGWIQLSVLMMAMNLMFDISWGNLLYLIPFASLVILTVTGFGLMIAGLVKTKQQAGAISAVLIVSTCMLGGVYWPIDIVPEFMQKIALGVPQSWAMSGFKEIISGSLDPGLLLKDTCALIGFSAVFFFIGLRGIRFE